MKPNTMFGNIDLGKSYYRDLVKQSQKQNSIIEVLDSILGNKTQASIPLKEAVQEGGLTDDGSSDDGKKTVVKRRL